MGFISRLIQSGKALNPPSQRGREMWRRTFGVAKEDSKPQFRGESYKPVAGGSYGRSMVSGGVAVKRLLEAFRSMAPGGWTDDRYAQSQHQTGIVHVAIRSIATQLAQSEFQVFVRDDDTQDGKRPVERKDPPHGDRQVRPYDLVRLLEKPNPRDSWGKWIYRTFQQKALTGMGLTWMVPNMLGTPMEMYCIPTALAIPQPVVNPDYPHGYYRIQPLYPYGPFSSYPTPTSAVGAAVPAQWVLRFLYPHPLLQYEGYSPLTAMRLEVDEFESIARARWYSMKRTFRPNAVLNFDEMEGAQPLPEPEIERIHAEWENEWQGPENIGRIVVGTPGAKLDMLGDRPVDMEYQQGWDQIAGFLLGGGYGITKPAAGMVEDSSYSTLFATIKQLNTLTLQPECSDTASDLTRHLAPFFGDDLIVEARCQKIDDHDINFSKVDKVTAWKGLPEKVIKALCKIIDVELDDQAIAELSKAGEGQGQPPMTGMGGAEQPPEQLGAGALKPVDEGMETADEGMEPSQGAGRAEEENSEPPEVTASRPKPGNLGRGALGPRGKSLNGKLHKPVLNGHRRR